ncbi:MAG: sarcosine oxidase subunit gamma [Rhodospirillales bacterium]|nr:sarcosine oxidase subunit gamma [Rhodospirillales bacterium]
MVERVSALSGHYPKGRQVGQVGQDAEGDCGVTFCECANLSLIQVAAWPDTLSVVGTKVAQVIGLKEAPGPGRVVSSAKGSLMRTEPLKWLLAGSQGLDLLCDISAAEGAVLDLSHSRTHLRISGPQAALLLNRHLPLDLREGAFPVGTVASSVLHHTGVTLWRSEQGFELLMVRGFALSLWQLLLESGAQFNAEVV